MIILIILNNHNSFSIVDLCADLQREDSTIILHTVCAPEFAKANTEKLEKRGLTPHFLDPREELNASSGSSYVNRVKVLEQKLRCTSNEEGLFAWFKRKAVKHALSTSVYAMAREWRIVRRFREKQKQALKLLEQLQPDVVLSLTDRSHDYVEGPLLWASQKSGIPVVLPYVAQFDMDAAVAYRHGIDGRVDPELCTWQQFSLYKFATYLRLRDQLYQGLFFQAPYILNAARRVGILSCYPWWTGNGLSDVVCVDSTYVAQQYTEHRVPSEKLAVVGHAQFDRVFRSCKDRSSLRAFLIQQYQLNEEGHLLILSVPQYAEQGYMSWNDHWRDIEDIIENVSKTGMNLLLSIHPRSDIREYKYLEEKYGCRIASAQLADIIGAADIFLASNSTTLIWAVLAGIRSVSLKTPVKYLYGHLSSIVNVQDSKAIGIEINNLLSESPFDFSSDWNLISKDSVFDGEFKVRFIKLIKDKL